MIKVLHSTWSGNFGGIEQLILNLTSVQKDNPDLEIGIMVARNEGPLIKEYKKRAPSFYITNVKSGYDIRIRKYRNIKHIFDQYDILHLHGFNPFVAATSLCSTGKVVYTEHGNFGFGRKRTIADKIKDYFRRVYLNSHVSYITFNSNFTEAYAQKCFGLKTVKSSVVYNGIPFDIANSEPSPLDSDIKKKLSGKFVVGTSSRMAGVKRIDRLIRAFSEFQKDRDAVLLLVGDGVLRKELEIQAEQCGIKKNTIFTGYQPNVRAYQQAMDVCVFPSQNEAFGIVAIEALSLGKPTLVFNDGGGIVEIIHGLSNSDVITDIATLAERLSFYYTNRETIAKSSNERIQFAKKFNIQTMENRIYSIYKETLSNN